MERGCLLKLCPEKPVRFDGFLFFVESEHLCNNKGDPGYLRFFQETISTLVKRKKSTLVVISKFDKTAEIHPHKTPELSAILKKGNTILSIQSSAKENVNVLTAFNLLDAIVWSSQTLTNHAPCQIESIPTYQEAHQSIRQEFEIARDSFTRQICLQKNNHVDWKDFLKANPKESFVRLVGPASAKAAFIEVSQGEINKEQIRNIPLALLNVVPFHRAAKFQSSDQVLEELTSDGNFELYFEPNRTNLSLTTPNLPHSTENRVPMDLLQRPLSEISTSPSLYTSAEMFLNLTKQLNHQLSNLAKLENQLRTENGPLEHEKSLGILILQCNQDFDVCQILNGFLEQFYLSLDLFLLHIQAIKNTEPGPLFDLEFSKCVQRICIDLGDSKWYQKMNRWPCLRRLFLEHFCRLFTPNSRPHNRRRRNFRDSFCYREINNDCLDFLLTANKKKTYKSHQIGERPTVILSCICGDLASIDVPLELLSLLGFQNSSSNLDVLTASWPLQSQTVASFLREDAELPGNGTQLNLQILSYHRLLKMLLGTNQLINTSSVNVDPCDPYQGLKDSSQSSDDIIASHLSNSSGVSSYDHISHKFSYPDDTTQEEEDEYNLDQISPKVHGVLLAFEVNMVSSGGGLEEKCTCSGVEVDYCRFCEFNPERLSMQTKIGCMRSILKHIPDDIEVAIIVTHERLKEGDGDVKRTSNGEARTTSDTELDRNTQHRSHITDRVPILLSKEEFLQKYSLSERHTMETDKSLTSLTEDYCNSPQDSNSFTLENVQLRNSREKSFGIDLTIGNRESHSTLNNNYDVISNDSLHILNFLSTFFNKSLANWLRSPEANRTHQTFFFGDSQLSLNKDDFRVMSSRENLTNTSFEEHQSEAKFDTDNKSVTSLEELVSSYLQTKLVSCQPNQDAQNRLTPLPTDENDEEAYLGLDHPSDSLATSLPQLHNCNDMKIPNATSHNKCERSLLQVLSEKSRNDLPHLCNHVGLQEAHFANRKLATDEAGSIDRIPRPLSSDNQSGFGSDGYEARIFTQPRKKNSLDDHFPDKSLNQLSYGNLDSGLSSSFSKTTTESQISLRTKSLFSLSRPSQSINTSIGSRNSQNIISSPLDSFVNASDHQMSFDDERMCSLSTSEEALISPATQNDSQYSGIRHDNSTLQFVVNEHNLNLKPFLSTPNAKFTSLELGYNHQSSSCIKNQPNLDKSAIIEKLNHFFPGQKFHKPNCPHRPYCCWMEEIASGILVDEFFHSPDVEDYPQNLINTVQLAKFNRFTRWRVSLLAKYSKKFASLRQFNRKASSSLVRSKNKTPRHKNLAGNRLEQNVTDDDIKENPKRGDLKKKNSLPDTQKNYVISNNQLQSTVDQLAMSYHLNQSRKDATTCKPTSCDTPFSRLTYDSRPLCTLTVCQNCSVLCSRYFTADNKCNFIELSRPTREDPLNSWQDIHLDAYPTQPIFSHSMDTTSLFSAHDFSSCSSSDDEQCYRHPIKTRGKEGFSFEDFESLDHASGQACHEDSTPRVIHDYSTSLALGKRRNSTGCMFVSDLDDQIAGPKYLLDHQLKRKQSDQLNSPFTNQMQEILKKGKDMVMNNIKSVGSISSALTRSSFTKTEERSPSTLVLPTREPFSNPSSPTSLETSDGKSKSAGIFQSFKQKIYKRQCSASNQHILNRLHVPDDYESLASNPESPFLATQQISGRKFIFR